MAIYHKKSYKKTISVSIGILLLLSMALFSISMGLDNVVANSDDSGGTETRYQFFNTTTSQWEDYDPNKPHSYNQNPANWWIPDANRGDSVPYLHRTKVIGADYVHQYYDPLNTTGEGSGWIEYDPLGDPHKENEVLGEDNPAYYYPYPYWASTQVVERGTGEPVEVPEGEVVEVERPWSEFESGVADLFSSLGVNVGTPFTDFIETFESAFGGQLGTAEAAAETIG